MNVAKLFLHIPFKFPLFYLSNNAQQVWLLLQLINLNKKVMPKNNDGMFPFSVMRFYKAKRSAFNMRSFEIS